MSCGEVVKAMCSSPVGPWEVDACSQGLHHLKLSKEVDNNNFLDMGCNQICLLEGHDKDHKIIQRFESWMKNYFDKKVALDIDICSNVADSNESFRQKVWLTLKESVKFGETISYGKLAALSGSPGASQSVGSAMANNPVSLIIPCHRVIKADGSAGNYSKATKNDVKLWLLEHESSRN